MNLPPYKERPYCAECNHLRRDYSDSIIKVESIAKKKWTERERGERKQNEAFERGIREKKRERLTWPCGDKRLLLDVNIIFELLDA